MYYVEVSCPQIPRMAHGHLRGFGGGWRTVGGEYVAENKGEELLVENNGEELLLDHLVVGE